MTARTGDIEPRLFTPPLRPLTPETSDGFRLIEWAAANLPMPLLPHQETLFKRALELNPDGTLRFRTVLMLAGRQGGSKSTTGMILTLWRMFEDNARLCVVSSAQLDNAREFFNRLVDLLLDCVELGGELKTVRRANGQEAITLVNGARMKIVANNDRSSRGLSADLVLLDELRTHKDHTVWAAISPTVLARPRGQIWAMSNAGTNDSVVLNALRAAALAGTDETVGIFEWSAVPGSDLDDEDGWYAALPALGRLVSPSAIRSALSTTPPNIFRAEYLCERVSSVDALFDLEAWAQCADPAGDLSSARSRVCAAIDVAPDNQHVTLAAAATAPDGRIRTEIVAAWPSVTAARAELPALLARVKPRKLGYGAGPAAAALGVDLRNLKTARLLTAPEIVEACGGFVEQVASRRILHNGDPLAVAHVTGATRLPVGDGFRFARKDGHVDACYAMAFATWLARSLPATSPLRLITTHTDIATDGDVGLPAGPDPEVSGAA